MNLRLKLLLAFTSIAFIALAFFGFIAYETTRNSSVSKEISILQEMLQTHLTEISAALQHSSDTSALIDHLAHELPDDMFLFVTNESGELISALSRRTDQPNINLFVGKSKERGQEVIDGTLYTWFSLSVDGTPYHIAMVHAEGESAALSYLNQMGTSLAVAGFIVLWLSAWLSLYVSGLIEKLNQQKVTLEHQAMHDGMTGLPNRVLLADRLEQAILMGEREHKPQGLMFIDLNRFKQVNDSLGHHAGDELLVTVSKRLRSCMRKSDTVSRLSGDEFAVVLRDVDKQGAEIVATKIIECLEQPIEISGETVFISASIGIALYPTHADEPDELLRYADHAMYVAKESGTHYEFYSGEDSDTSSEFKLANELRIAIERKDFVLNYQPKFDIKNKLVIGAEALIRWVHPSRGVIPPAMFIEVAEKTGLIKRITYWVMETAFQDGVRLYDKGFDIVVSINLSAHNLHDPQFIDHVRELVASTGCNPYKFIFEITESAVMSQVQNIASKLEELQQLGFQISIDDFGTGYSSFVNLKELPVNEIKIDRSFVFNSFENPYDASIVRATVEIGKSFGICVVAEGVETEDALEMLDQFGCNIAQGYLFSKPIDFDAFVEWLSRYSTSRHKVGSTQIGLS